MREGASDAVRGQRHREIQVVERGTREYPEVLEDLSRAAAASDEAPRRAEAVRFAGPPERLYAIGDLAVLAGAPRHLVAIVGTREASGYGLRVARALGRAFAEAGAVVVSGMARGIDSAAHLGALEAGGTTIAVLGTGPDVPYPVGNRELHDRICGSGLVLSESEPGRAAFQGCFPRRNRIIAALARATIVVEAGHKSGALNTASQALQLGRVVGAVPGMIDLPRSAGSNQLMRDGGQVIATVDDALGLLSVSRKGTVARPQLSENEADVWDAITAVQGSSEVLGARKVTGSGVDLDAIVARTGLPVRDVIAAVANLELAGLVAREAGGEIIRTSMA